MRYIAFLRGINVGGHNVKMADLRALFSQLGLTNVSSYIQTGNIFFETDVPYDRKLEDRIEEHLENKLGYAVPAFVRRLDEVEAVLREAPFHALKPADDTRFMILFLSDNYPNNLPLPYKSDRANFELLGANSRSLYVVWHLIEGRPPSSLGPYLHRQAPSLNTTGRFFHTTQKILKAAQAA